MLDAPHLLARLGIGFANNNCNGLSVTLILTLTPTLSLILTPTLHPTLTPTLTLTFSRGLKVGAQLTVSVGARVSDCFRVGFSAEAAGPG